MIVRGDGSIVKADSLPAKRPVEFIHSGPATSAIGGQFLSQASTALVIDIGTGTTGPISPVVEDGKVQVLENAATVGLNRTCRPDAESVYTYDGRALLLWPLGGDSLVPFDHTLAPDGRTRPGDPNLGTLLPLTPSAGRTCSSGWRKRRTCATLRTPSTSSCGMSH